MDIPILLLLAVFLAVIATAVIIIEAGRRALLKRFLKGVPEMLPDKIEQTLPVSQLPSDMTQPPPMPQTAAQQLAATPQPQVTQTPQE